MLNWEGYMGTYNSLAPHIQFSKPVTVTHVNREQVIRDFLKHAPNWAMISRAWGGLSAHVTSNVLRNCLESAAWPGRMDFDACLRDAYKEK